MNRQEYKAHRKARQEALLLDERAPAVAAMAALEAIRAINMTELAARAIEARAALIRYHSAKRRAAKLQRTPPWADQVAIRLIYEEAHARSIETGEPHHVDHDIPLQGELVSGLHVHNNLQVLTGPENIRKSNRFEPCSQKS